VGVEKANSLYLEDFDKDGFIDIVVSSNGMVMLFRNNGNPDPEFIYQGLSDAETLSTSPHFADLDGDGDDEVLSRNVANGDIFWFETDSQLATGGPRHIIVTGEEHTRFVQAVDMNADGHLDILCIHNDTAVWYQNDGLPEPSFLQHVIGTDYMKVILPVDMDNDGDLDILSIEGKGSSTYVYENTGGKEARFTKHPLGTTDNSKSGIKVADFNNDGYQEVLSVSNFDDVIILIPNYHSFYTVPSSTTEVFSHAAMDEDGNTLVYAIDDNLSATEDASYFSINANTGELTFSNAPSELGPADANGDNLYEITITVSDGYSTLRRRIVVSVFDNHTDDGGVDDEIDTFPLDPLRNTGHL